MTFENVKHTFQAKSKKWKHVGERGNNCYNNNLHEVTCHIEITSNYIVCDTQKFSILWMCFVSHSSHSFSITFNWFFSGKWEKERKKVLRSQRSQQILLQKAFWNLFVFQRKCIWLLTIVLLTHIFTISLHNAKILCTF